MERSSTVIIRIRRDRIRRLGRVRLHDRRGRGDQRMGPGRGRDARGGTTEARGSAEARVREARVAAGDPGRRDVDVRGDARCGAVVFIVRV